jgi:hypothetical protein
MAKSFLAPNRGTSVLKKIDRIHSGKERGFIYANIEWLNHAGKPTLHEKRRTIFTPAGPSGFWTSLLTALVTVKFGDHGEGAFSTRLTGALEETPT